MKYSQIGMKKYAKRSEAKKNTEKLKEGLKSSILGPQNLGSGVGPGPGAPPGSASEYIAEPVADPGYPRGSHSGGVNTRFCQFSPKTAWNSSVGRQHGLRLWGSDMIDPSLKPHQCLFTSMWMRMALLPCWLPRGLRLSHQRWISGNV